MSADAAVCRPPLLKNARAAVPPAIRRASRADCSRPPCRRRGWQTRRASTGIGSRPLPAMAPSMTALTKAPLSRASLSISNSSASRALALIASASRSESVRPSPMAIFSFMAKKRLVEAIVVVRSGVTKPAPTPRAPSINSLATNRSMSAIPGVERQHRALVSKVRLRHRQDLDVIGGRASALRHAGDRGRLHGEAAVGGGVHDPVRQHPAALAAERGDEEGEGAGVVCLCNSRLPLPATGMFPPPLWGRVREGGRCLRERLCRHTPVPLAFGERPSPQGGG